jgi:hypothetical protein
VPAALSGRESRRTPPLHPVDHRHSVDLSEAHDCPLAERLIRRVKPSKGMLSDKAYEALNCATNCTSAELSRLLPNRSNGKHPFRFSKRLYKLRWRIECTWAASVRRWKSLLQNLLQHITEDCGLSRGKIGETGRPSEVSDRSCTPQIEKRRVDGEDESGIAGEAGIGAIGTDWIIVLGGSEAVVRMGGAVGIEPARKSRSVASKSPRSSAPRRSLRLGTR